MAANKEKEKIKQKLFALVKIRQNIEVRVAMQERDNRHFQASFESNFGSTDGGCTTMR